MKGIIFTENIDAIMEGRKTHTRRVVNPQPPANYFLCPESEKETYWWTEHDYDDDMMGWFPSYDKGIKPRYQIGEIAYLKEAYCPRYFDDNSTAYKADYHKERIGDVVPEPKWKSPMYMPRSVARTFLRITGVWVERVQDITPQDCHKEGVINKTCAACLEDGACHPQSDVDVFCGGDEVIIDEYADLWDKLHDKDSYSWDANPWVFAYEFERVSADLLPADVGGLQDAAQGVLMPAT